MFQFFQQTSSTLSKTYWISLVCQHVPVVYKAWLWCVPSYHHDHSSQILSYNLSSHPDERSRFKQEQHNHDLISSFNFQMVSVSACIWCQHVCHYGPPHSHSLPLPIPSTTLFSSLEHQRKRHPELYCPRSHPNLSKIIVILGQPLLSIQWWSCFIYKIVHFVRAKCIWIWQLKHFQQWKISAYDNIETLPILGIVNVLLRTPHDWLLIKGVPLLVDGSGFKPVHRLRARSKA
jgi:hypothetical protein